MRSLWSILLSFLILAGCSSEDQIPSAPPCADSSQPKKQLSPSPIPERLDLAFDQKTLIRLLWTDLQHSECFLRKNGNVQLYKVSTPDSGSQPLLFANLKPAPAASQTFWQQSAEQVAGRLLGLTTFDFYTEPQEKIIRAEILVRAEGRPWHLWHEYIHYLIGQLRMNSPQLSLRQPRSFDVEQAWQNVITAQNNSLELKKAVQKFSDLHIDYLQKKYVEEILIEVTLRELISQAAEDLKASPQDFLDSLAHTEMYLNSYLREASDYDDEIFQLLISLPKEQADFLSQHAERLKSHQQELLDLTQNQKWGYWAEDR